MAVDDIPETGFHIEIEAPETMRAELAEFAGVRELVRLSAVLDLARRGAGARVTGHVSARVGQSCVVTLEPIESDIEETVDLRFAPQLAQPASSKAETAAVYTTDDDPPEPILDGKLDLGAIATEFLLLGIDPYPRKAGAEFAPVKADDASVKPFAALEALKKRLGGG